MKKIFLKLIIILIIACQICSFLLFKKVHANSINAEENAESFNVRVTREEFAEFHDTLILENENTQIDMEKLYFSDFNLSTGNLSYDEIFSVNSPKFEPGIFSKLQEKEKAEIPPQKQDKQHGIYNITLSGSKNENKKIAENSKKSTQSEFFTNLNKSEYSEKIKQAFNLIKAGEDSDKIAQILLELEQITKNDAKKLSNVARLYIKTGNPEKACILLEQAENLSPNDFKVLYTHAICLYKQNKLTQAEKKLNKITELKPDFMFAYYNLGNIYYKNKNYHKAINAFKKAMSLAPENPDIYFNIALTLEMLDYKQMAKKFYQKCLELRPNDKEAIRALENPD